MLIEELKKATANANLFENAGIILFCPNNTMFYKISFGDGSDDEPIEGCDTYLYITMDTYDGNGFYHEDVDGGNMWFKRSDYSGLIFDNNMIKDALEFVNCPDIEGCIFISQFV